MPIFWTAVKIMYVIVSTIIVYRATVIENTRNYSNKQNQMSVTMFLAMTNFIVALVVAGLLIEDIRT
jgi:aconitase A